MRIHNPGSSMFGLLNYHETKVEKGLAEIIGHFGMRFKDGLEPEDVKFGTKLARFQKNMSQNDSVSKPTFHASINPSEHDIKIMDDKMAMEIAQHYMKELGYSNSPFMLYKHNDVDRTHYHIVGSRVDDEGKRINDFQEQNRSNKIREAISLDYGFKMEQTRKSELKIDTQKIEYGKSDVTSMIKRGVLASVAKEPSSWQEFKTELKALNIGYSFVNNEGKKGLLYHVISPDNGKRLGVAIKSSLISKEAGIVLLSQSFKNGKPNKVSNELKEYTKAENVLNSIYRDQRRSGAFYFESDLIRDLPKQKNIFSDKLLERIPSLKDNSDNIFNHFIQSKNNTLKDVELKEQGYFAKNVSSLLEFTKNFDKKARPTDVAQFYAANNLTISKNNDHYKIGHQKGGKVLLAIPVTQISLPETNNIVATTLKKNDRDMILAFSDPQKMEGFIQQNGHLGILKNQTFNLLDNAPKTRFLQGINSHLLNDITNKTDVKNKDNNTILTNLFINGFMINQSIPNKNELKIGHYGLGNTSQINIPKALHDSLAKNTFGTSEIENYTKLGFLENGKPRPLYTALVTLNSAINKNNKEGIEKSLNFIRNFNNTLGDDLINKYNKIGNQDTFRDSLNRTIFKELENQAYGQEKVLSSAEYTQNAQVSNTGSSIAAVFDFSPSGKGVQAGGAPKDRFEGKKSKKIKTTKIKNK